MSRSRRTAKKRAHLIAHAVWVLLGTGLVTIGIMVGARWFSKPPAPVKAPPLATPKPVPVPVPKPEPDPWKPVPVPLQPKDPDPPIDPPTNPPSDPPDQTPDPETPPPVVREVPVVPEKPEAKPDPEVEARKREDERFKALRLSAAKHRANRDPAQFLVALRRMRKLRPKDPSASFGMGEVYLSAGPNLNFRSAETWFEKFLTLSDEDDERRDLAMDYISLAKKRRFAYLVSSWSWIDKARRKNREAAGRQQGIIDKGKASIEKLKANIESIRGTKLFRLQISGLRRQIKQAEDRIADARKALATLDAELERIPSR
jgi:hypothetical protein